MTRQEAIKELKEFQNNGDTEAAHGDADDVLCKMLRERGFEDVVDEYHKVKKWYA